MSKSNAALLLFAVILTGWLILQPASGLGGTDDQAKSAIGEIRPDYRPWTTYLFEPSEETESLLFALQAAVGAGFIGYFFGYLHGKKTIVKRRDV